MTTQQVERVVLDEARYDVDEASGCWNWRLACLRSGHAVVKIARRVRMAYRVYFEYFVRPLAPGQLAHHRCRNPRCVNPEHIEPVTPAEHARIHAAEFGKLSPEKATEMRRQFDNGASRREIGRLFQVSQSTVSRVLRQLSWAYPADHVAVTEQPRFT
jgi:hypothetical protein